MNLWECFWILCGCEIVKKIIWYCVVCWWFDVVLCKFLLFVDFLINWVLDDLFFINVGIDFVGLFYVKENVNNVECVKVYVCLFICVLICVVYLELICGFGV